MSRHLFFSLPGCFCFGHWLLLLFYCLCCLLEAEVNMNGKQKLQLSVHHLRDRMDETHPWLLQWKVSVYIDSAEPFPFNTHTHTADNTTSCDAFLCDVKLAASGLRGTAQDVWEGDKKRGKEKLFIWVEDDKMSHFVVKENQDWRDWISSATRSRQGEKKKK